MSYTKMFPDDVKLSAVNAKGLQRLLYLATKWAKEKLLDGTLKTVLFSGPKIRASMNSHWRDAL